MTIINNLNQVSILKIKNYIICIGNHYIKGMDQKLVSARHINSRFFAFGD